MKKKYIYIYLLFVGVFLFLPIAVNLFLIQHKESKRYLCGENNQLFGLVTSTYVKSKDEYGIEHYGFKWSFYADSPRFVRFKLGDIDPDSIRSKPQPSLAFVKEHDLDEHPEKIDQADLFVVEFFTPNYEKKIEIGSIKDIGDGKNKSPVFDQKRGGDFFVFESKDRAERFVTAFVYAVKMCGGKSSMFQPTPSKP